jgi:hypothetical protein
MTTEVAADAPIAVHSQADLTRSERTRVLTYLGVLTLLVGFGSPFGGLIAVPVSYFLKNKLHFSAIQVSEFQLVTAIPLYISALWGLVRDNWNPFGIRDRGYIIIFGFTCAGVYIASAFAPVTAVGLGAAMIALSCAFLFVRTGQLGLASTIGKQHVMSGQVAALWNAVDSIPLLLAYSIGGFLSNQLESQHAEQAARTLFLVGAVVMLVIGAFALWRPRVVYDKLTDERDTPVNPFADIGRLARHWPIYPALFIWFLWNFAPGSATPLQFYLQNTLHADDATFSLWNAIFAAFFIPTYILYGVLCRHVALGKLIFWGTLIGIPQLVPLLFIHSPTLALISAAPSGLMGGLATAAYLDLIIRSCPKGLEGTVLMMTTAFYYIVSRLGDLLGTTLYEKFGGFTICVIAVTIVYALILPAIWLVPRRLLVTKDGETVAT